MTTTPSPLAPTPTLLDAVMPKYEINENHSIWIDALPERVYAAVREVTPGELPALRALSRLRSLPVRLIGRQLDFSPTDRQGPFLDQMLTRGFTLLANQPNRELVIGVIGRPWRLTGDAGRRIQGGQDFPTFTEPGYAVVAMNFALRAAGDRTLLTTETRVRATDPASLWKFHIYWLLIGVGSAAIRRDLLRAIKRRAETA
ncbi:MAG: hypothetical protein ACR2PL_15380 [Dehalococcoidia bacterium]